VSQKEIVGTYEFKSIGDEPGIDVQIDEWLQQYPQVSLVDVKYQVVPYVEGETLNFATFALVLYHEPADTGLEINKAVTQQMQLPPELLKQRRSPQR
jgi:hypothetical protein